MKSLEILSSHFNIVFLVLWLLNDLFLKSEYPGLVTGKVSDIIGVYLSPFIITAVVSRLFKAKETNIFWFSIGFIAVLFFGINIDQSWNDFLYSLMSFGFGQSGVADLSDLFCLVLLPLTCVRYFSKSNSEKSANRGGIKILILSVFVFINTSPLPSGRSNFSEYIFLLNSASDTILLESPIDSKSVANLESFTFRF
ncbi:MAG: hypothetical protein O9301_12110, partial [Leptospira sp.]|nr:hypothetical protein [Leptospira sp.]